MACRGVFFALTSTQEEALVATRDDDEVRAFVEDVESAWDEPWLCETDKAWDAMHRCLSDGTLGSGCRASALDMTVLGGGHHHEGDEYVVAHLRASEVVEVAAALETVTEEWMRQRYDRIDPSDYQGLLGDEDFAYTWYWFVQVQEFYRRAATAQRAVIFTVRSMIRQLQGREPGDQPGGLCVIFFDVSSARQAGSRRAPLSATHDHRVRSVGERERAVSAAQASAKRVPE
jgi:Domain of unknown function (DUF1877)